MGCSSSSIKTKGNKETPKITLYGSVCSSPTRAVLSLLIAAKIPYEHVEINPLTGETKTESFKAISPHGTIPLLCVEEKGTKWYLNESPAIMRYLIQTFDSAPKAYGTCPLSRAKINEYIDYQHTGVKAPISKTFFAEAVAPKMGIQAEPSQRDSLPNTFKYLDGEISKNEGKIVKSKEITIADLLLTNDLISLNVLCGDDYADYPNLKAYFEKMSALPHIAKLADEFKGKIKEMFQ